MSINREVFCAEHRARSFPVSATGETHYRPKSPESVMILTVWDSTTGDPSPMRPIADRRSRRHGRRDTLLCTELRLFPARSTGPPCTVSQPSIYPLPVHFPLSRLRFCLISTS